RTSETDDLVLAQYFPVPGTQKIEATLRWEGKEISAKEPRVVSVVANPAYRGHLWLKPRDFAELAVMGLAMIFAAVTGLSVMYDPTFGSIAQYAALFLWAAGASTGGNMFKELGTTSTAGGRVDTALP